MQAALAQHGDEQVRAAIDLVGEVGPDWLGTSGNAKPIDASLASGVIGASPSVCGACRATESPTLVVLARKPSLCPWLEGRQWGRRQAHGFAAGCAQSG